MDQSVIQANIFFFITSIAVILVTLLIIVLLMYLVLILKDFRGVSHKVKEETDLIALDINEARAHLRKQGGDLRSLFDYFKSFLPSKRRTRKK